MPELKSYVAHKLVTPPEAEANYSPGMRLKVAIIVDPMGSMMHDADEECEQHKETLKGEFPGADLTFYRAHHAGQSESGIQPGTDIVVIDFGGMMPGASDLTESNVRHIIQWCQDNSSSLCLVMSSFTYRNHISYELEENGLTVPNLVNFCQDYEIPTWFRVLHAAARNSALAEKKKD